MKAPGRGRGLPYSRHPVRCGPTRGPGRFDSRGRRQLAPPI